jgi:hypothetical protein
MINFPSKHIFFEGNRHYYDVSLSSSEYFRYEGSALHYLKFYDQEYRKKNWREAFVFLCNILIDKGASKETLLQFKLDWTKQDPFSLEERVNHLVLSNGIYANCNLGVGKTLKMIHDLLKYQDISLDNIKLQVTCAPEREEKEIRDYFKQLNETQFYSYLINKCQKKEADATRIINIFKSLDKRFKEEYPFKHSLFSFQSGAIFSSYCSRFRIDILPKLFHDENKLILISTLFDDFKKYYYEQYG